MGYLVQLQGDKDAQGPGYPEGAVDQEEDLRPALPRIGAEPEAASFA